MDELIERIRQDIRHQGYKTATRIKIELSTKYDNKTIKKILSMLTCYDIRKVEYTNNYVSKYYTKKLFYYNPKRTKKGNKTKRQ
jgi:hypothetical protein